MRAASSKRDLVNCILKRADVMSSVLQVAVEVRRNGSVVTDWSNDGCEDSKRASEVSNQKKK